jgi:Tfp pilus assembly protein PilF
MQNAADFGSSTLIAEVRALLRQGAIEEADVLVDETLARAPENAEAWYLRGLIANRRRKHETAIVALRKAVAFRPDAALAWLALGTALTRFDKLADAAEAYRAAAEREPRWADAHFNLGVVLKRRGDRRGAARAMHAAWVRDPMMFEAAAQCVAIVADCVRADEWLLPAVAPSESGSRPSFSVVVCSIDRVKRDHAVALYRRLFAGFAHEIDTVWCPRSLAEAYNAAVARSSADIVVLSHDDVDVLAPDFATRLVRGLAKFDALGVVVRWLSPLRPRLELSGVPGRISSGRRWRTAGRARVARRVRRSMAAPGRPVLRETSHRAGRACCFVVLRSDARERRAGAAVLRHPRAPVRGKRAAGKAVKPA